MVSGDPPDTMAMKANKHPLSCANKLKVLGDPTRLAVLESLMSQAKNVGELMDLLHVEQSLLSHHLAILREAGLVEASREGKAVFYQLPASVSSAAQGKAINLGCCTISFDEG
jgi:ArsR family transcriptional regulator, nickel/cobalt-responsive transcriptional repressor